MKYLALLLLLLAEPAWRLLTGVRDRNVAVADGTAAYVRGDADRAAWAFAAALAAQGRRTPDPRLLLNLAHAQKRAGQRTAAQASYGQLLAGTPARIGSVARQQLGVLAAQRGELAQALGLLRQALLLDPTNAGARYNYEVLSEYLARRPNRPQLAPPPSPANATKPDSPKPTPEKEGAQPNKPSEKAGTDRQGEIDDPSKPNPTAPNTPPASRPDDTGVADTRQPSAAPGTGAAGNRPGAGTPQPVSSGAGPGTQRGLDRSAASAGGSSDARGNRPGSDAATAGDRSLQTQRERLQAMNLSPAQARQLLETLRAQEQQYLQQLTRPATQKPDPNKPTW